MSDFKRPPDGVCFFKTRENTLCDHEGWTRKPAGNWDTGGGRRRTLVNPEGAITEDGWVLVDNTGFYTEDLLEAHTAGAVCL